MTTEAFLLSPYRPPTSYAVSLNADEAAAWLHGYFALWHPAVLARITRPPQASSSYDHDQPGEGTVYAVAEGPQLYQPDDWANRVRDVNAIAFRATASRTETMANLRESFGGEAQLDLPPEAVLPFQAVGYGYLIVETLFDAADHEHLLDVESFWSDVAAAVQALNDPQTGGPGPHLKAAAEKLQSARETLTANPIHLLD